MIHRPVVLDRINETTAAPGLAQEWGGGGVDEHCRHATLSSAECRRRPGRAGPHDKQRSMERIDQASIPRAVDEQTGANHLIADADRRDWAADVELERSDGVIDEKGIRHETSQVSAATSFARRLPHAL